MLSDVPNVLPAIVTKACWIHMGVCGMPCFNRAPQVPNVISHEALPQVERARGQRQIAHKRAIMLQCEVDVKKGEVATCF